MRSEAEFDLDPGRGRLAAPTPLKLCSPETDPDLRPGITQPPRPWRRAPFRSWLASRATPTAREKTRQLAGRSQAGRRHDCSPPRTSGPNLRRRRASPRELKPGVSRLSLAASSRSARRSTPPRRESPTREKLVKPERARPQVWALAYIDDRSSRYSTPPPATRISAVSCRSAISCGITITASHPEGEVALGNDHPWRLGPSHRECDPDAGA